VTSLRALHFFTDLEERQALPVRKTITLGTHRSAKELKESIERTGYRLTHWAKDILNKSAIGAVLQETDVNLVFPTVRDLGFAHGAPTQEIYDRAQERGLERCPAEVGPQLRRQHLEQWEHEWLIVAMEPINDYDGNPTIFMVGRDDRGNRWLYATWGGLDFHWDPNDRFVFISP